MTAVEWLFEKLWQLPKDKFTWYNVLEQAKEMEKRQHGNTWDKALDNYDMRGGNYVRAWQDFDDYYNETYGSGVLTEGSGAVGEKGGAVSKGSDEIKGIGSKDINGNEIIFPIYSKTEISDEEIAIGRFMNWFLKHYSTATIDGFFGYVNAMGQEVRIQDILKDYRKLNGIENN